MIITIIVGIINMIKSYHHPHHRHHHHNQNHRNASEREGRLLELTFPWTKCRPPCWARWRESSCLGIASAHPDQTFSSRRSQPCPSGVQGAAPPPSEREESRSGNPGHARGEVGIHRANFNPLRARSWEENRPYRAVHTIPVHTLPYHTNHRQYHPMPTVIPQMTSLTNAACTIYSNFTLFCIILSPANR